MSSPSINKTPQQALTGSNKIWTRNFLLVSLASTAFFASMHMLTPSMPLYLVQFGTSETQTLFWNDTGIILSAFIITSLIFRPFIGYWSDRDGPKRWMILGAILFLLMPLSYSQTLNTPMFLLVRVLHGFGFGCFMTAASAFITLEVPASRRAEGLSHYSNAIKLAMAGGPYLGLYLATQGAYEFLFFLASGISLITLFLTLPLGPAQFHHTRKINETKSLDIEWNKLIQKAAIFPGLVMTTNSVVFGTLIPFTPIFAKEKGFINGEVDLFYVVYAFSLIFSRALTGPISDKFGRSQVIIPGMIGVSFTLGLLALANDPGFFLIAAALYGLSAGTVQPSLMAMVADRVPDEERGAGMATFTLLNDLGIALGTFLCGHFGPEWGYLNTLNVIICITILGIIGFITYSKYFDKVKLTGASIHVS